MGRSRRSPRRARHRREARRSRGDLGRPGGRESASPNKARQIVFTGIEERERRIGKNETLFREVNERLNGLNDAFSSFTGTIEIVCECGDIGCILQLTIPPSEYEYIRSESTWFAVIPGHEKAEVEQVVANRTGYDIVQKREGPPADVSRATDPRS